VKRILAYVHERIESERAVEIGAEIARRNQGSLTALAVVEPAALAFDGAGVSLGSGGLAKTLLGANEERLAAIAARAERNGVGVSIETRIGAPWLEVSRSALRSSGDLVIKLARGRRRLGWPLFGSTALHLIRKCPAAVWLAAPHGSLVPRRILVVVSPEPGAAARNAFEAQILARAAALAELFDAELDVLCCWQLTAEDLLTDRLEPQQLLHVLEGVRGQMHGALDALLEPLRGRLDARRVHLQKGELASVAAEFVEDHARDRFDRPRQRPARCRCRHPDSRGSRGPHPAHVVFDPRDQARRVPLAGPARGRLSAA
jgi:nucleotide-binding universal stress UspA family protein